MRTDPVSHQTYRWLESRADEDGFVRSTSPLIAHQTGKPAAIMLARVMLLAVDHVLSGKQLVLETARELVR